MFRNDAQSEKERTKYDSRRTETNNNTSRVFSRIPPAQPSVKNLSPSQQLHWQKFNFHAISLAYHYTMTFCVMGYAKMSQISSCNPNLMSESCQFKVVINHSSYSFIKLWLSSLPFFWGRGCNFLSGILENKLEYDPWPSLRKTLNYYSCRKWQNINQCLLSLMFYIFRFHSDSVVDEIFNKMY